MNRLVAVCAAATACGRIDFAIDDKPPGADARDDGGDTNACGYAGALFCDGFENQLAPWDSSYGTLAVQSTTVHAGALALQATSTGPGDDAGVSKQLYGGQSGGEIDIRGWFYIPSGFALTKIDLFSVDGPSANQMIFLVDQGELRVYDTPGANTVTSSVQAPRDQWFCIQVRVTVDATAGAVELDLDDGPIGTLTALSTLPVGGYVSVSAGLLFVFPNQSAASLYVDYIVAGTQPLSCN